ITGPENAWGGVHPTRPTLTYQCPNLHYDHALHAVRAGTRLLIAIQNATGPMVLVGNEIGLGVIPMGREVRAFVDALGCLNQDVAAICQRVTLMAAGLPLTLKDAV
ncbi:MAG: bifunctional adenosylcobinamide kinase/adenosylcobinamide-phosphate guanylyltransferase, partial [Candidatus Saccharibacteria bacterium]|nr:bifunctional adenosylcobinamide kinase/adenosylcobinamide-phosphate guanylyltransferase [Rhodoferax sp.]